MPDINAPLLAFNRGEVAKTALARIDAEKLRLAADAQVNWQPSVVGAMMLRPGQRYIGQVYNDLPCILMDFAFGAGDTALLELTASRMRIWIGEALLTRPAVSTTVSDGAFAGGGTWDTTDTTAGCTATIGGGLLALSASARGGLARAKQTITVAAPDRDVEHGLRIVVDNGPVTVRAGSAMGRFDYLSQTTLDTGTHSLSFVPTGSAVHLQIESTDARTKTLSYVGIEASGIVNLPTPWALADLETLRWTQAQDVIYVGRYGGQQYRIERRGTRPAARGWSVVKYRSNSGPFGSSGSGAKLTPSVMEGNGTLASDLPVFNAGHVGALFRLFTPGQTNLTTLGGGDAYTEPIRVAGVENDRKFGWNVSGTWAGTLTLQRSVVGPKVGFVDVAFSQINGLFGFDDSTDFNNAICWYRVGFKADDYDSGAAQVYFGQNADSDAGTVEASIGTEDSYTAALHKEAAAEQLSLIIRGDYQGTVTLQRSNSSDAGPWTDFATYIGGGDLYRRDENITDQTGVEFWYRLGIKTGEYTSGTATCTLSLPGSGGDVGGSSAHGAAALAGGRYGICRVTGYTSPTSVSIEVIEPFSSLTAAQDWQEGDWSDSAGFPTAPAILEGRLWWLGLKIWGSQPNNYEGFATSDANAESLNDLAAIIESFGEGPADRINWGLPLTRLLCGRERSIASIRSSSFDEVVTPTNFSVKDCSEQGAQRLPALRLGKRGIFVQQSGRGVYELAFRAQEMDYGDRDLTRLNPDIGAPGFVDAAVAIQPDKTVYLPRADGQVACLLYEPDDEVETWWRWQTLGVIERVRVLPSMEQRAEDSVYFVVRRTVNGVTRRFIEKPAVRDACVGGLVNRQFDSFISHQGGAVSSLDLAHLPNTTVGVWADGAYLGEGKTDGSGHLAQFPDGQAHANVIAGITGAVVSYKVAAGDDPVTTMPGLAAYEGLPCELFADQQPSGRMRHVGAAVVSGGQVVLPNGWKASSFVACFGYVAPFMSAKLAYSLPGGSPISRKKRIGHVGLLLFDAGAKSLKHGQRFDALEDLPEIEQGAEVDAGTIWAEYDEATVEAAGEWDTDARLCLLAQAPFPVKVAGVVVQLE